MTPFDEIFARAKAAVPAVAAMPDDVRAGTLRAVADAVDADAETVLSANASDLSRMPESDPKFDRLRLTRERLAAVAADMRRVAGLPSPLGRTLDEWTRPDGLAFRKVSVPFGVVGVIYEARPNVTLDVFALCFKSGNVALLKGSRDAAETNAALARIVSVCNALDCLLVHEALAERIPEICAPLAEKNVRIFADERGFSALAGTYPAALLAPATAESFGTEFLDYAMSLRVVPDADAALAHIARFGSKHSECVVAEDERVVGRFFAEVDAACVYANASTAFTDGGEFGFGAEIGISTQKLHARGPMGLPELTTYKYLVRGNGNVRIGG